MFEYVRSFGIEIGSENWNRFINLFLYFPAVEGGKNYEDPGSSKHR